MLPPSSQPTQRKRDARGRRIAGDDARALVQGGAAQIQLLDAQAATCIKLPSQPCSRSPRTSPDARAMVGLRCETSRAL